MRCIMMRALILYRWVIYCIIINNLFRSDNIILRRIIIQNSFGQTPRTTHSNMASRAPIKNSMSITNDRGTCSSVQLLYSGMRIVETLMRNTNGELLPTIYETPLFFTELPPLSTNYLILPNPTAEYQTRPHDMEMSLADFGSYLLEIARKHPICENLAAFASHRSGTNSLLTEDLLPDDLLHVHFGGNQFTIWYNLSFYDNTPMKIIKCNP